MLIDSQSRIINYLRLSVTDRCNLRCIYCMPVQGVPLVPRHEILTFQEIELLCRLLVDMGIEKIRVTGGEPLIRKGILSLLKKLREISGIKELCLTTNGVLLAEVAEQLKKVGVDRINVSLDSLDNKRFKEITSYPYLDKVLQGVLAAMKAGFTPLKINMVVMKGINQHEILDFVELAKEEPINVRFIEYMPFGDTRREGTFVPAKAVIETIKQRYQPEPMGETPAPARDYRIKGFKGWVSLISPVSEPFCKRCNRLRITAKGDLRLCLLQAEVVDLKTVLRRETDKTKLAMLIKKALKRKPPAHRLELYSHHLDTMANIGG